MNPGGHVVSMYVATSGASGPMLGSDEKEVILLVYAVIDTATNKVIGVQQYLVRPVGEFGPAAISATNAADQRDTSSPAQSTPGAGPTDPNNGLNNVHLPGSGSPAGSPNNSAVATTVVAPASTQPEHTITEAMIKVAGRPLGEVIEQFDQYLRTTLAIDPEDGTTFRLVTDGPLPLRQSLHPEACTKNLQLPAYYCRYNDLRKEFVRFKSADLSRALVAVKDASKLHTMPTLPATPGSIAEMMQQLEIQSFQEADPNFYAKDSRDMITLIQAMIAAGHQFDAVEQIHLTLEPGLCSIDDEIDGQCIVRARGLPWQSSDQDIANFFRGLNVAKGGVALCLSVQGRRNGEAMVRFTSQEHRDMALKRHKHHIGNRYIEVYRASGEDFLNVAGGASNEAQTFLSRGAQVIIRMRGLPYDCTAKQVLDFFANGNDPCTVLDAAEGILFVKKPDGRATGDAFVLFANETDAPKALSRHRESIGQRYIELFRSTPAEVQQVLNRSLDPKTYEPPQPPLIAQLPPVQIPLLPQHVITSGTSKSCIRLRGLPYEARVEHILHFLEDFANNIIYQGVHMVYNAQGQPSGEAFIQMDSEDAARASAQLKHNKYMVFGKKYRYIEVFQCSGDDMNLVLNGGLHSPANATKPALLSPGGTMVGPAFSGYAPFGQPGPVLPPPPRGHHLSPAYYPQPILYWGYPSPPVSPTAYYGQPPPPHNGHPQVHGHHPHLHHGMAHHQQPALPPPAHSQPQPPPPHQQPHPHQLHQQQQQPFHHHHPHNHQPTPQQHQYRTPRRPLQFLGPPQHPIPATPQSPQLSPVSMSQHPTYLPVGPVVTLGYAPATEPSLAATTNTVISHTNHSLPHDTPSPAATISPLPQPAALSVQSTTLDPLPPATAPPPLASSQPIPIVKMPGAASPTRLVRSASSAASVGRPPAAVVASNQFVEMFSV